MEIYYADICSKCGARNFIYGGDPEDCTGIDPDGYQCWECKEITPIGESEDDTYIVDGQQAKDL